MIEGFLAAIGTLLSWSVGTLAFTRAARRIDPGLLNKTRLMLAVLGTGLIACVAYGQWPWQLVTGPPAVAWLWLSLSGIVGLTVGDYFGFTSLMILGARRQSVIGTVAPIFALGGGWALLNESVSWLGIAGTALTIGGVMWSMSGADERSDVRREGYGSFKKGLLFAIAGAACQGLGLVLAKLGMDAGTGSNTIPPFHAAFMRMVAGFASIYVFDRLRRAPAVHMALAFRNAEGVRPMLLGSVSGPILGVSMSLLAASKLGAGMAQTIFSMVPFVVMAIAALLYGERIRMRVAIGAIVAVCGVILLMQR